MIAIHPFAVAGANFKRSPLPASRLRIKDIPSAIQRATSLRQATR
jgi:hypothetical protein